MEKFSQLITKIGILIISIFINNIYASIFILPTFLLSLTTKEEIYNMPLIFSLLLGLMAFSFEGLSYAYYQAFVKEKKYFKAYFFKSIKENFLKKYFFYLALFALAFYGCFSLYKLRELFKGSNFLYYFFLFIRENMIFFTIMQLALRENVGFSNILRNSLILMVRYFLISAVNFLILTAFLSFLKMNLLTLYFFINLESFALVFVNQIIA